MVDFALRVLCLALMADVELLGQDPARKHAANEEPVAFFPSFATVFSLPTAQQRATLCSMSHL